MRDSQTKVDFRVEQETGKNNGDQFSPFRMAGQDPNSTKYCCVLSMCARMGQSEK